MYTHPDKDAAAHLLSASITVMGMEQIQKENQIMSISVVLLLNLVWRWEPQEAMFWLFFCLNTRYDQEK